MTDATSDVTDKYAADHNVDMLGMLITLDGTEYQTVGQDRLTTDKLLALMENGSQPTTSAIPTGAFVEHFESLLQAGQDVLYLAFSSGLSGTYQSAMIAKDMVSDSYPDRQIIIIDTLAAASGQGALVYEAVRLRDAGLSMSEIAKTITELVPKVRSWVMVDDLQHLARGGRISKAAATVGGLINIKPLIDVDPDGKLRQVEKVRGAKKAVKTVIDHTLSTISPEFKNIYIGYSGDDAQAQQMAETLRASDAVDDVTVLPLGPTIAAHTGKGTIAVFSFGAENRA